MFEWMEKNWIDVVSYLGIGGGSSILGMKLIDKEQNKKLKIHAKKIQDLDHRTQSNSNELVLVKSEIDKNSKFDEQLREDIKTNMTQLNGRFTRIEEGQDRLLNKVIELIKR